MIFHAETPMSSGKSGQKGKERQRKRKKRKVELAKGV